jgi:hypothetical protein
VLDCLRDTGEWEKNEKKKQNSKKKGKKKERVFFAKQDRSMVGLG